MTRETWRPSPEEMGMGEQLENKKTQFQIDRIDPDDTEAIKAYYQFEIDQGFSEVNPQTTLEKMIAFRQQQIQEGKLGVVTIKDEDELVATAVVALENGTMGKALKDDEAWAAGTVVDKEKQGLGLGEKIANAEDQIALDAGKKAILTNITNDNFPSMRVYMKTGYELEAVDKRTHETSYVYRKNLTTEQTPVDWQSAVGEQPEIFQGKITKTTPDIILIDPQDDQTIKEALQAGYRGIHLLSPKDLKNPDTLETNLIVFNKN